MELYSLLFKSFRSVVFHLLKILCRSRSHKSHWSVVTILLSNMFCLLNHYFRRVLLPGEYDQYIANSFQFTVTVAPGGRLVSPAVWIWTTPSFGLPPEGPITKGHMRLSTHINFHAKFCATESQQITKIFQFLFTVFPGSHSQSKTKLTLRTWRLHLHKFVRRTEWLWRDWGVCHLD